MSGVHCIYTSHVFHRTWTLSQEGELVHPAGEGAESLRRGHRGGPKGDLLRFATWAVAVQSEPPGTIRMLRMMERIAASPWICIFFSSWWHECKMTKGQLSPNCPRWSQPLRLPRVETHGYKSPYGCIISSATHVQVLMTSMGVARNNQGEGFAPCDLNWTEAQFVILSLETSSDYKIQGVIKASPSKSAAQKQKRLKNHYVFFFSSLSKEWIVKTSSLRKELKFWGKLDIQGGWFSLLCS